jgi:hypothetical protein
VDGKNNNGDTALHWASRNGHLDTVRLLLENDAVVDGKNNNGDTALHWASRNGHLDTVRLLLEKDGKNKTGDTALHLASRNGHLETVRLLWEKGAAVEVKNEKGETAVDVAKANGHSKVVTMLSEIMARNSNEPCCLCHRNACATIGCDQENAHLTCVQCIEDHIGRQMQESGSDIHCAIQGCPGRINDDALKGKISPNLYIVCKLYVQQRKRQKLRYV